MSLLQGLIGINVELTNRCNKACWCCGRRKNEPEDPGDMSLDMVRTITRQLPDNIMVQLHNNGEPLLYPYLQEAIMELGTGCRFIGLNTNAKLLCDKAYALQYLDSLTISIIQDDQESDFQLLQIQSYLEKHDLIKPRIMVFRVLGVLDFERKAALYTLAREHNIILARRQLHAPAGSFDYDQAPTVPEMGVCLEALSKLSIDKDGNVSPCVRFDPDKQHVIGSIKKNTLEEIWTSARRETFVKYHKCGKRYKASPVCATCEFWGVPRG